MSQQNVSFGPSSDYKDSIKSAMSCLTAIDLHTTQIIQQPTFNVGSLASAQQLPQHQAKCKATADTWKASVRGAMIASNEATLAYNNEFSPFYEPLYELAGKIGTDPAAKGNLIQGVNLMIDQIEVQRKTVIDTKNQLSAFSEAMGTNLANVEGDDNNIMNSTTGDPTKIKTYQNAIKACNDAINKDLRNIGLAGPGAVVSGLVIAVGVLVEIETVGASTALIIVGLAGEVGSVATIALSSKDISAQNDSIGKYTTEIAKLQAEMAMVQNLHTSTLSLAEFIREVLSATDKLLKAWDTLKADYAAVVSALQAPSINSDFGMFVQANLEAAKKDWEDVAKDAQTIKDNMLNAPPVVTDPKAVPALRIMDDNSVLPMATCSLMSASSIESNSHEKRRYVFSHATGINGTPMAIATMVSNPPQPTSSTLSNWFSAISNGVHSVDVAIQALSGLPTSRKPDDVTNSLNAVTHAGPCCIASGTAFVSSLEAIAPYSAHLSQIIAITNIDVQRAKATSALTALSNSLKACQATGTQAKSLTSLLYQDSTKASAALGSWLQQLKTTEEGLHAKINSVEKAIKKDKHKKHKIKNDWWYCTLGPVACAAVAVEVTTRLKNENSSLSSLQNQLNTDNADLRSIVHTINLVKPVEVQCGALGTSLDKCAQFIQVVDASVNATLTALPNALSAAFITAQLQAIINNLTGLNTNFNSVRAQSTRTALGHAVKMALMSTPITFQDTMQDVTNRLITATGAANVVTLQPDLIIDNTTFKQDQQLLLSHCWNWKFQYASEVLAVLSSIKGLGNSMHYLTMTMKDQTADVRKEGFDLIDSNIQLMLANVSKANLALATIMSSFGDDVARFKVVADELVTGQKKLATLQSQEVQLTNEITGVLTAIGDGCTKAILQNLTWMAVTAVTVATGQIELTGTSKVVSQLVIRTTSAIIKSATSSQDYAAASRALDASQKGLRDSLEYKVNKRDVIYREMATYSTDFAILRALSGSLSCISSTLEALTFAMKSLTSALNESQRTFLQLKYEVDDNKVDQALQNATTEWMDIATSVGLLMDSFENSS